MKEEIRTDYKPSTTIKEFKMTFDTKAVENKEEMYELSSTDPSAYYHTETLEDATLKKIFSKCNSIGSTIRFGKFSLFFAFHFY